MATKKLKAPNKTENDLTAAAQAVAALPAPATKETIDQAAEMFASLAATTVATVLEDREGFRQAYRIIESRLPPDGAESRRLGSVSERGGLLERHHAAQERQRRPNGGYPDSLISWSLPSLERGARAKAKKKDN
ncbi:MAG: hypothetical protein ACXWSL_20860 [Bdellovibrionota bacterium]